MAYWPCDRCRGTGAIEIGEWRQFWNVDVCPDCGGDGHARPGSFGNALMGCVVWCAGRVIDRDTNDWQFQGVFATEQEAASVCRDETWFIGPAKVGAALPVEGFEWPDAYYPLLTPTPQGET